ncbi:MAG: gliding motility-associated C-terminal domain-containing protein [Saprospiraceae bacterium]|nr:gliding motility-associated C-terminal domain-containing protein [Saprospiraceae bacterium]
MWWKAAIAVVFVAILAMSQLQGQPFPCDRNKYIAVTPAVGQTTQLRSWTLDPATGQPVFNPAVVELNVVVNALGYSVIDGHLYGLDPLNGNLYRINSAGNVTDLGVPNGLDLQYEYYAGEIGPNGQNIYVIGRTRDTKVDRVMYSIGLLGPTYHAGYVSVVCDWASSIGDVAFNPLFGILVGFDNNTRRLVDVSTGGNVTSTMLGGNSQLNMGSLFYDEQGRLFGYGSTGGPETQLYQINTHNGQVSVVGSWVSGRFTDGCSCPYQITFDKKVLPAATLPCTEVTYRYEILNTAGIAYGQAELRDTLPSGFEIISISGLSSLSIIESGVGSHILHIRKVQTLLDLNVIEVVVRVGLQTGTYASQATLGPFPYALGGTLLSDDPGQPGGPQPTPLRIIGAADLIADTLLFLCQGSSRNIEANPTATSYQWNSGETTDHIGISSPGVYTLTAIGPCGEYVDSIEIKSVLEPLWVDLGPDRAVSSGDETVLQGNTNAGTDLLFEWNAQGDTLMSCSDCPHPLVAPTSTTIYSLVVTDENGCVASDTLKIDLLPALRIYAPNAFSPNSDGINDVFYLQGKGGRSIDRLRIFDRWGNVVFDKTDGQLNDPDFPGMDITAANL